VKRIAILIHDMYHELEMWVPYYRLKEAGHNVLKVGCDSKRQYASKIGLPAEADVLSKDCAGEDFDAVIIPGGFAPDKIRMDKNALEIVRAAYSQGKLIASICHGPWVLISAGIMKGKKATCFAAIKDDLINAGAQYLDEEVVIDGNIITSRKPDDIPAFCREIVRALEK